MDDDDFNGDYRLPRLYPSRQLVDRDLPHGQFGERVHLYFPRANDQRHSLVGGDQRRDRTGSVLRNDSLRKSVRTRSFQEKGRRASLRLVKVRGNQDSRRKMVRRSVKRGKSDIARLPSLRRILPARSDQLFDLPSGFPFHAHFGGSAQ